MRSRGALLHSDKVGVAVALLIALVHRCKAKFLLRAAARAGGHLPLHEHASYRGGQEMGTRVLGKGCGLLVELHTHQIGASCLNQSTMCFLCAVEIALSVVHALSLSGYAAGLRE